LLLPISEESAVGILLAFAPFFVFVVIERTVGVTAGLIAAALVAALLFLKDLVTRKELKVLDVGTLLLFGGLAVYARAAHPDWSVIAVRLRVDAGLLLIVLASIAIRKPFTMQYAREQVAEEHWSSPEFLRINKVLTGAWAVAFAVMVAAEAALLYVPAMPKRIGIIITVLAIVAAIKFTSWYPERDHAKAS
jgi:hypothetical protein